MNRSRKLIGSAVVLLAFAAGGYLALSGPPVLLHTHLFASPQNGVGRCGVHPWAGPATIVFNPFRDQAPERVAEVFLHLAAGGNCLPEWSQKQCDAVRNASWSHAQRWTLRSRLDTDSEVIVIYCYSPGRAGSGDHRGETECNGIVDLRVARSGGSWKVINVSQMDSYAKGTPLRKPESRDDCEVA